MDCPWMVEWHMVKFDANNKGLKGFRAAGYFRLPSGWTIRQQTSPVSALTSVILLWSYSNVVRTFISLWSRTLLRFCLIKYSHNGPFNEPNNFGIHGLILRVKVIKFGTNAGINMFINKVPDFIMTATMFWRIFYVFFYFAHWKSPLSLSRPYFFQDHICHIFTYGNVYLGWVRLRRFCFIKYAHHEPFNEPNNFVITGLFCQVEALKMGTNV